MTDGVTRILLAALGGEGGGVLMNWVVDAARKAGYPVQATSVPGVAQRTGSTSYYIEIAPKGAQGFVLGLVPMAGRVDVVVSSELVETARVLSLGFVSPNRTTVISSNARQYSTAEKIAMGDGRYSRENVRNALDQMAKQSVLLDLGKLAEDHGTFVSATMFGALAGSGTLPWGADLCRTLLEDEGSRAGFDAACAVVQGLTTTPRQVQEGEPANSPAKQWPLPQQLQTVLDHGASRTEEFQDAAYARLFRDRAHRMIDAADLENHQAVHAVTEGCRRLALWMAYEDVARVADLKTRKERFERIRQEVQLAPGQVLTVTEYLKPRAEEIADILPAGLGRRIMVRVAKGGWFPFLGKGRYITSNGILGYRLLRFVAALKHIRRWSLRYAEEQDRIEVWLAAMERALKTAPDFAMGLGELPRVLKGYSDTLLRGKSAYDQIWEGVVQPALDQSSESDAAAQLRSAIGAALADDTHEKLKAQLAEQRCAHPARPTPDLSVNAANA